MVEILKNIRQSVLNLAKSNKGRIAIVIIVILFFLPRLVSSDLIWVLGLTYLFIIMVVSWDFLAGYTGQLNMGHSMFIGVGGYTAALLFLSERFGRYSLISCLTGFPDLPVPVLILIGGIVSAVVGLIVGVICLRLKGYYLVLVTAMLPLILLQITGIWLNLFQPLQSILVTETQFYNNYYFALISMLICLGVMLFILNSRWGLIFKSIRENENLARSTGINTLKYKLIAFSISAFFAGIAGGLFAFNRGLMGTDLFVFSMMMLIILSGVLGGTGTFTGAIIGGALIYYLKMEVLGSFLAPFPSWVTPETVLFIILVILILIFPKGIVTKIEELADIDISI